MIVRTALHAWLACALIACQQAPATESESQADAALGGAARPDVLVPALPLTERTVFEGTGQLLAPARGRASVALPLTASIVELRADKGQEVRENDVLAVVIIPEAARAAAQLAGERLRQEAYRERLQHLERLRAEGLARAGEITEYKARLRESEASALEAQALLATIEATGLRRRGRGYEVRAPLSGVIVELHAALGGVHGPSDGPLLVVLGGVATRVETRFAFAPPLDVSYRLLAPSGASVGLRMSAKAPQLSAADATQVCWLELEQPIDLAPGTLVRVQIVPAPDLWVVPQSALTPALQPSGADAIVPTVLATLGDQALVRARLPAQAQLRVPTQVAAP